MEPPKVRCECGWDQIVGPVDRYDPDCDQWEVDACPRCLALARRDAITWTLQITGVAETPEDAGILLDKGAEVLHRPI